MSDRKQPQVPQLNLGGFAKSNGSKGMNNIDPRKMQQYEKMQDEDSEYDDESDGSNEDQIGLM